MNKKPVIADTHMGDLIIPHIGVTLRVLLAAANNTDSSRHVWRIVYKGVPIGTIKIKTGLSDV